MNKESNTNETQCNKQIVMVRYSVKKIISRTVLIVAGITVSGLLLYGMFIAPLIEIGSLDIWYKYVFAEMIIIIFWGIIFGCFWIISKIFGWCIDNA